MSTISQPWSQEIGQRRDSMVALRQEFHRHPELSFKEHRTAEIIAERLHEPSLRCGLALGAPE